MSSPGPDVAGTVDYLGRVTPRSIGHFSVRGVGDVASVLARDGDEGIAHLVAGELVVCTAFLNRPVVFLGSSSRLALARPSAKRVSAAE